MTRARGPHRGWMRGVAFWLVLLGLVGLTVQGSAEDAPKAKIHRLRVQGDRAVEVVYGPADSDRVIVYMHGVCGNPLAFDSWAAEAGARATFISMRGDLKCEKRKRRYKWSYNLKGLRDRIDRVVAAVSDERRKLAESRGEDAPVALDASSAVLIGYSQGAHRVEAMAGQFPERFSRVVIIAPAKEPQLARLKKAKRVLLLAGEKDAKKHIYEGFTKLKKAGIPVRYAELPGARHGEYGPEAPRVMAQGLDWLYK